MPKIEFQGQTIDCAPGERLGDVLKRAKLSAHNGVTRYINCHGLGSCGTCAVEVDGDGASAPRNLRERLRLALPPLRGRDGLRLACQLRVAGDLEVVKHPGFWGQRVGEGD